MNTKPAILVKRVPTGWQFYEVPWHGEPLAIGEPIDCSEPEAEFLARCLVPPSEDADERAKQRAAAARAEARRKRNWRGADPFKGGRVRKRKIGVGNHSKH